MKVILYMAMSVNGMIAKKDDDTSFVTKAEWKSFSRTVQKAGTMVIGRRTYEVMAREGDFPKIGRTKVVVLSSRESDPSGHVSFFSGSPRELIKKLRKERRTVVVAGGGRVNASFLKEGLVDELYIDIEPVVFGSGIPLFRDQEFEKGLRLVDVRKLSANEVQLHYKIV